MFMHKDYNDDDSSGGGDRGCFLHHQDYSICYNNGDSRMSNMKMAVLLVIVGAPEEPWKGIERIKNLWKNRKYLVDNITKNLWENCWSI